MTNLSKTIDELSVLVGVTEIAKAGPPREGLVPQSGDPEHPGRWIKPDSGDSNKEPKYSEDATPKELVADMTDSQLAGAQAFWNRMFNSGQLTNPKDIKYGLAVYQEMARRGLEGPEPKSTEKSMGSLDKVMNR